MLAIAGRDGNCIHAIAMLQPATARPAIVFLAALAVTACGSSASTDTNITGPSLERCQPTLTPSAASYGPAGGTGTVSITVARECTWTAKSEAAWLVLTSAAEGQGDGSVSYRVERNAVPVARRGGIIVREARVELSQDADACRYEVSVPAAPVDAGGAERLYEVRTHAACEWRASSSAPWVSVTPASGRGDGNVRATIAPNDGGERRADISIADERIVLTQSGRSAPPPAPAPVPPAPAPTPPPTPPVPAPPTPAPTPPAPTPPAPTPPAPAPPAPTPPAPTPPAPTPPAPTPPAPTPPAPTPPAPTPPTPAPPAPPPEPTPLERIELDGRVEALSGSCPSLTFRLEGHTVYTSSATNFDGGQCRDMTNGAKVELRGRRMSDGRVRADQIAVRSIAGETVDVEGRVSELSGSCPNLTFRVDGTTVVTSADTRFRGGRCDRIRNGAEIEVKGRRLEDGRVRAEEVEIDD